MPIASEFEFIRWVRSLAGPPKEGLTGLGIGDDCAILHPQDGSEIVVTTDMLMDGRHFDLSSHGAEAVGRKAMGVNLSDIAAMAAIPRTAFVALALPNGDGNAVQIARELHAGIALMADRYGVTLAGGDTNAWDCRLVICITIIGEAPKKAHAIRRSGAKPGDAIYVTGSLGGSILGRHMMPQPRITEALALREAVDIHALIDISDGLASDLGHILEESGNLGAILEERAIPRHPDAEILASRSGNSSLDHALHDGEDFELCVVLGPEDTAPPSVQLIRIGTITAAQDLLLCDPEGNLRKIEIAGFDHLKA